MGVNTDGQDIGPGSSLTDGVEDTEKSDWFEQETGNEKSLFQDAEGDVGIQEPKMTKVTGIPLITPLQHMPSQPTSGALDTEHNEAQREHTDREDRILSNTPKLLRPDAYIEDEKTELSQGALVNLNTDTSADDKCAQLGECTTPLQPGEIREILETDGHRIDDWDAMYNTLLDEISPSDANAKLELPFNPDIDEMDEEGYTPLYKAALEGDLERVDDVISRGADPDKPSKGGLRPLHAAARNGHAHIVDFLILQGADVSVECERGQTPLHTAAAKGYVDILESFTAEEANVNVKDNTGWTPLNAVVQHGHIEAVKYLLTKGANQNRYDGMPPLYAAAEFGNLGMVKFFTSNGADINAETDKGMIPLHGAAAQGHLEVMEYLIQQGSDVNKEAAKGCTPFNAAVQYGHIEAVKCLMTKGAKQNRCDGMTPLYTAARLGHLDIVRFLVSNGADVNEEDDGGMIPLHGAAGGGHLKVMEYLIQQGSDVNKSDAKGWTPINAAVQEGHLEAVKYLMTKGAKQNRYDGMIPLFAAAQLGHLDIVRFFISNGADVNKEDDEGMTPLHGAAARGHLKVMEYLIQQGSNVNKTDNTGRTPFNVACQYGHPEAVKYLMTEGAKQNRYNGMNPLYAAAQFGHLDIVKLFIANGTDVNEEDDEGEIPLHGAAAEGHLKVMEYLIHEGSDVNKNGKDGWTPLHAAVRNGHLEVVKVLLAKGAQCTGFQGLTPLNIATQYDYVDVVQFLVSNGYHLNETSEYGKSHLNAELNNGNMDIVNYLFVHHNANVNGHDHDGWTPLHAAAQKGHQDIVDYLTLNGAAIDVKDIDVLTPLQSAANTVHQHTIEDISPCRGDPDEEEIGGSRSGSHQNLITRGNVTATMKDADTQSRAGKLASEVDDTDEGNDCIQADFANRGADELSLNNPPTGTLKRGGNEEHNPFINAKLKYPDEGEQDPMLNHMEPIKCSGTRKRDTISNGTDDSSPHGSLTWQYSGLDPPYLQTMETDGHPSEESESRCHSLNDENREMRESSSPMNARNHLPIDETSLNIESFPTYQPAVVRQKLDDGNPVSTQGTSSNPVWKIGTKCRTSVYRCPSILALVQTFLHMIVAFAIIIAGSPVLVAGSDITERVTLQAGKPGVVPFHLPWSPNNTSHGVPYYIFRFESKSRPFCINGQPDIEGFKSPSQLPRFATSVTNLETSPCVNLIIDNVETLDEDGYVLTVIWFGLHNVWRETIKKEIFVLIPPGPAQCFMTLSKNSNYPYEVHCRATSGSVRTTLSCYQNDQKIDVKGDITDNGLITRGTFWLPDNAYLSCCSHDVTSHVNETMCNDFEWPPIKETTRQSVNTVSTSVSNNISRPANERPEITPTSQSHTESGACGKFMLPFLWHYTYLFLYILTFATIY